MTTAIACDFLFIGAGIAGASAAALLATQSSAEIIVLEREQHPGYHSTGRSAAVYIASYGNAVVRKLNRASWQHLAQPPDDFAATGFVSPRGEMYIADADRAERIQAMLDELPGLHTLNTDQALAMVPALRPDAVAAAAFEPNAYHIDVHALHSAYLRQLRRAGGRVICNTDVCGLRYEHEHKHAWRVQTTASEQEYHAGVVINAAGAWADTIATLAGLTPLGLQPLRRTAALSKLPAGIDASGWPTVADVDDRFYCTPDAGLLLISPCEETAVIAQDAAPDELALAHGVNAFEQALTLSVERLEHRWAGLRTFAPDRTPVVGYDSTVDNFFWLAGQGGYGIQTAPAMAELAAALLQRQPLPETLQQQFFLHSAELAPARLQ